MLLAEAKNRKPKAVESGYQADKNGVLETTASILWMRVLVVFEKWFPLVDHFDLL